MYKAPLQMRTIDILHENNYRLNTMPQDAPPGRRPQANSLAQKRISSEDLFEAQREVVILHNGREYRLRLTQSGKLILTA